MLLMCNAVKDNAQIRSITTPDRHTAIKIKTIIYIIVSVAAHIYSSTWF